MIGSIFLGVGRLKINIIFYILNKISLEYFGVFFFLEELLFFGRVFLFLVFELLEFYKIFVIGVRLGISGTVGG